MNKHYHQLSLEQRYQIWSLHESGATQSAIGLTIKVDRSTVSRELKRNSTAGGYQPKVAEQLSQTRKRSAYKACKRNESVDKQIIEKLRQGWSPGAISERIKLEKKTQDPCLSHTSIYRMIAKDKAQQGVLHHYLPNTGKTRWKGGKRKKQAGASLIPNRIDITERPLK